MIEFSLPPPGEVSLEVHDVAGRVIATLVDGERPAGHQRTIFEGRGLASGVYFVVLRAQGVAIAERLVLLQ